MKTRILSALAAALVTLGASGGAAADAQTAAIEAVERERAAAIASLARECNDPVISCSGVTLRRRHS